MISKLSEPISDWLSEHEGNHGGGVLSLMPACLYKVNKSVGQNS